MDDSSKKVKDFHSPRDNSNPLRILLVKPNLPLLVARRLNDFLHLEPLELEIVAGGVPLDDEVFICDLTLEKRPMKVYSEKLESIKPHIVGITGYSNQALLVKEMATIAKEHSISTVVVAGGIHATLAPQDYAVSDVDIIVRGEGGTTFGEIIKRFKKGEPLHFGGVALSPNDPGFKEKAELSPPKFPMPKDIPRPRRDLVRRLSYFSVWTDCSEKKLDTMFPRIASIRTSYGCAFTCSFCVVPHMMGGKYLERTPEDVVDEISNIKEDHIYFVDDETFLNAKRMTKVANLLLEMGIKKQYVSWARSDTIIKYPELFRLWKKAGLRIVYVGLEAMDQTRLEKYEKRSSVDINMEAISILREIGITLHASLMVDPDFSVEDFLGLQKVIKEVSPAEMSFTVYSPSPGTKLWDKHRNDFICEDPYLFYDCMHTLLPTRLGLGKFYAHFALLYRHAWSMNPLRLNGVRVPRMELFRAIYNGVKYIFALRAIVKDYTRKA